MNTEDRAAAGAGLSLEVGDDRVALLEFDQPGVEHNRFTLEALERLSSLLQQVEAQASEGAVEGLVLASAKPDSFIVGVDVAAIAAADTAEEGTAAARRGQAVFQQIADLPVAAVAAINGTCLGGATEMALACTWRLAADTGAVEIGLPEVNLGIFPGFGGSQRLPRLISLERALRMILTGKPVDAQRARRHGLVDAVVPAPLLLAEARRWALGQGVGQPPAARRGRRRAPEDGPAARRARRWLLEGNPLGRALVFRQAAANVRKNTGGNYPAPPAALDTVRRGLRMSLDRALELEARRVGELIVSDVAKNLIGVFFLRQAARRRAREGFVADRRASSAAEEHEGGAGKGLGEAAEGRSAATRPPRVRKIGVVGAGVMGGGIAQIAAYNEIPVRLKDIERGPLTAGLDVAHRRLEERRRAGRLTRRDVARRMGLIRPTLQYSGFRHADLVIEAVVERVDVKRQVFAELEGAVGPETVLATNTSSLTLAALAPALRDPGRLVGLHFFNPVHRMPLVEVVRGSASRPAAVATAAAFAIEVGKVPVIVGDAPGFFVNRVLMPYLNEALLLFEAGVPVQTIDGAIEGFGMPMGPLRLLDEIGLDVSAHVTEQLGEAFADRIPPSDITLRMRDEGRLGRKSRRGFYRYGGKGRPRPDPELGRLLGIGPGRAAARPGGASSAPSGASSRSTSAAARPWSPAAEDIVDRCLLAMLNETCLTLGEGVIENPREADLALVFGIGFPPFRGGLCRWADARGLAACRDRLEGLAAEQGGRFEPAARLEELVDKGESFYPPAWPARSREG